MKTRSSETDIIVKIKNVIINRFRNVAYMITPKTRFLKRVNKSYLGRGGVFLDIGCHSGNTIKLAKLLTQRLSYIGFDLEDYSKYLRNNEIFYQVDVEKDRFPLEDNSVDIITIVHLIEHIADHKNLFSECRRVLKQKGCIYIETPGIRRAFIPSFKIGLDNAKFRNQAINFFDDATHINLWTIGKLVYALKDFDFCPQKFGVCRNIIIALLSPITIIIGTIIRHRTLFSQGLQNLIGVNIYCVAKLKISTDDK